MSLTELISQFQASGTVSDALVQQIASAGQSVVAAEGSHSDGRVPTYLQTKLEIVPGLVATIIKFTCEDGKTGSGYVPGKLELNGTSDGRLNFMLWSKVSTSAYIKVYTGDDSINVIFLDGEEIGLGSFSGTWSRDNGTVQDASGYFKWTQ